MGKNELPFTEEQAKLFVGPKADYYWRKWSQADDPDRYAGFNWAALLAGFFWLGYRRMYQPVYWIIGFFVLTDLLSYWGNLGFLLNYRSSLMAILLGLGGNTLYYQKAKRAMASQIVLPGISESPDTAMRKRGGTSWGGVGWVFVLTFAYFLVNQAVHYLFV